MSYLLTKVTMNMNMLLQHILAWDRKLQNLQAAASHVLQQLVV